MSDIGIDVNFGVVVSVVADIGRGLGISVGGEF